MAILKIDKLKWYVLLVSLNDVCILEQCMKS